MSGCREEEASRRSCRERLRDLAHGMGKEVAVCKAQEGTLWPQELRSYLEAVYDVIEGTDAAAAVLEDALVGLEKFVLPPSELHSSARPL